MTVRSFALLPALARFSLVPIGTLLVAGCSETPPADETPGPSGGSANTSGAAGASAGSAGAGGVTASAGSSGSAGKSSGGSANAGTSSGGAALGGAGAGGSANSPGGSAGVGMAGVSGAGSSAGGSSGTGGSAGDASGGSSAGTPAGGSSAGGASGAGAAAGAAGSGGGSSDPCPSNASFCSGFEDAELPEGAVFKLNGDPATPWTTYFEVDATVKKTGNSSLRTRSEINGYRMLAVPTGGATFWVRMYMRSDRVLGEIDHNVFAQAARNDEPNDGEHMEFAEDVGLSLHFDDGNIRWPEGYGRIQGGGTNPFTLPADAWHCIEFSFDGQGRSHQFYVDGTLLIDAQSFPASAEPWAFFKFGYNALHGTVRNTWYDDVAVAPTRIGCL